MLSVKASGKEICYSHILPSHDGRCKNLHGHNGVITVEVFSKTLLAGNLFVTDYKYLKKWLNELDDLFDHKFITSLKSFKDTHEDSRLEFEFNDINIIIPLEKVTILEDINETSSEAILMWIATNKIDSLLAMINGTNENGVARIRLEFRETTNCIATLDWTL